MFAELQGTKYTNDFRDLHHSLIDLDDHIPAPVDGRC